MLAISMIKKNQRAETDSMDKVVKNDPKNEKSESHPNGREAQKNPKVKGA